MFAFYPPYAVLKPATHCFQALWVTLLAFLPIFFWTGAAQMKNQKCFVAKQHFPSGLNSVETLDFSMDFSTCHYNDSKPGWGGSPAKAEDIGNNICGYVFICLMPFWDFWEHKAQEWVQGAGCAGDNAAVFCDAHKPNPKGHNAQHRDAEGDGFFGGVQGSVGDGREVPGEGGIDNANDNHKAP